MGTQWPTLIHALIRRHSEKPEVFQEMIDRYFPSLPKIEFARGVAARPGWDVWGPEAVMPEKPHTLKSPTKDQGELEVARSGRTF
jgi:N6-adenosine-specific RNA methylase IME4